jgi:tetratricopeptide (TPR) repeat protein
LSFANSERVQLRRAAREAAANIGKPAWGHYKDLYKDLTGENPPRDWDWERTLRELLRLYDGARMAKVYDTWREGKAALEAGKFADAASAFDQVLARAPMFEHRAQMAPAYHGFGKQLAAEKKPDEAQIALRKALRLGIEGADKDKIESLLATLEGEALIEAGTPDRHLLQRALELDPDNERAKELLASLEVDTQARTGQYKRYLAAGGIGLVALLLLVWLWRPRKKPIAPPPPQPTPSA